jgi:hypothetical protein
MRLKLLTLIVTLMLVGSLSACEKKSENPPPVPPPDSISKTEPISDGKAVPVVTEEESSAPLEIKAEFPEAKISKQHTDLTSEQISTVESATKSKLENTSFDTYVAYHKTDGEEVGRASVVVVEALVQPAQLIVVYNNDSTIEKVTLVGGDSEIISPEFLAQFPGKTADQAFKVGQDIKYRGKNKAAVQTVAQEIKRDSLVMKQIASNQHPIENQAPDTKDYSK